VLISIHSEPRGTSPYFQRSWIAAGQTELIYRRKKTFPRRTRSRVQILADEIFQESQYLLCRGFRVLP
jgi:hypothetical protein